MAADTLRLFIAIDLPPHTRDALAETISSLRRDLRGPIRWVAPESVHLTLKFLGDVERARVDVLADVLRAAVAQARPFRLSLHGTGTFPARGSPRVIWAGTAGDQEQLLAMQATLEEALVSAGEPPQDNAFRPHFTLARVREPLPRSAADALRERLASVRFEAAAGFDVGAVSLIHSTLTREGPIYRTVVDARLGG